MCGIAEYHHSNLALGLPGSGACADASRVDREVYDEADVSGGSVGVLLLRGPLGG